MTDHLMNWAARKRVGLLISLVLLAGLIVLAFAEDQAPPPPPAPPANTNYDSYFNGRVACVEDLADWFAWEQFQFLPINAPDPDFILSQPCGLLEYDWKDFPDKFNQGLIPVEENLTDVYPVTVIEDFKTRETVFFNAKGEEIYALPPPSGYDPRWYIKTFHPEYYSGEFDAEEIAWQEAISDPARIQITFDLLPTENVDNYLSVQELIWSLQPKSPPWNGEMQMMRSLEASNHIVIDSVRFATNAAGTNGIAIIVDYPDTFTNRLEFYACSNLIAPDQNTWFVLATNLLTTGTNSITYWDFSIANCDSNFFRLFYVVGNADVDSDGEGLVDGRELYLYRTDPNSTDSDSDLLSDYEEVINRHTDPNNNDTNRPTVTLVYPAPGERRVWIP